LADERGYFFIFFMYQGPQTPEMLILKKEEKNNNPEERHIPTLVTWFMKELQKATKKIGFNCFMDKWYGGLDVKQICRKYQINYCLACQATRPTFLFKNCLAIFSTKQTTKWKYSYHIDGTLALAYNDHKVCCFLCNFSDHNGILKPRQQYPRRGDMAKNYVVTKHNDKIIPKVVDVYNQFMNAVDKADACLNRYIIYKCK